MKNLHNYLMCTIWWIWTYEDTHGIVTTIKVIDISVQFSHSVVSDSLQPYESQHVRPPCPSETYSAPPKINSYSSSLSFHFFPFFPSKNLLTSFATLNNVSLTIHTLMYSRSLEFIHLMWLKPYIHRTTISYFFHPFTPSP